MTTGNAYSAPDKNLSDFSAEKNQKSPFSRLPVHFFFNYLPSFLKTGRKKIKLFTLYSLDEKFHLPVGWKYACARGVKTSLDGVVGMNIAGRHTSASTCTKPHGESVRLIFEWGLCPSCHGNQNQMEAILACHPALSMKWPDWVAKRCEQWYIRTDPIGDGVNSLTLWSPFLQIALCETPLHSYRQPQHHLCLLPLFAVFVWLPTVVASSHLLWFIFVSPLAFLPVLCSSPLPSYTRSPPLPVFSVTILMKPDRRNAKFVVLESTENSPLDRVVSVPLFKTGDVLPINPYLGTFFKGACQNVVQCRHWWGPISMLQCLHCTVEAHTGRNKALCLLYDSSNLAQ